MATASAPKTGRSFEPGPAPSRSTATHKVTPVPVPKPGSIPSLPPSANHAAAAARAANSTATAASRLGSAQAGFGLLNPTEANLQDASTGSHRDGRIRNPVPSKLKGKTDGSKGNFSVLHMDVAGRSEATERDAQAKRTSESTELAAKRAYENGYVPLKRSRFVQVPDETAEPPPHKPFVPANVITSTPNPVPVPVPVPVSASAVTSTPASLPAPTPASSTRRSPLNSEETKSEQARLLTLLRSLHPLLVVDQICKALAFFGGIPGAPPPSDGSFPQSAEANGSGSLFVGWIAEIFPKLGGNTSQQALSPVRQLDVTEATKRRRGRPKGSKATKARKDKGIKKGPVKSLPTADPSQPTATAEESWVDVDDADDDGVEGSDGVDPNVMLLAQGQGPVARPVAHPRPQPPPQPQEAQQQASQVDATPIRTALPRTSGNNDAPMDSMSSTKKRGRPKGSKNRPKEANSTSADAHTPGTGPQLPQEVHGAHSVHAAYASGAGPQTPQTIQLPLANPSFTAVNSASTTTPTKTKTGRPKAPASKQSKQKPGKKPVGEGAGSGSLAATSTAPNSYSLVQPQPVPLAAPAQEEAPGLTNQLQTHQRAQPQPMQLALQTPVAAGSQVQQKPGNGAQKRKRKAAKDSTVHQTGANGGASSQTQASSSSQVNGLALPTVTPSSNHSPQVVASSSAIGPPPAKRPRKSQESKLSVKKQTDPTPVVAGAKAAAKRQTSVSASLLSPALVPNPSPTPVPATAQVPVTNAIPAPGPSSVHISTPISAEPTMTSIPSPHHSHFEVQSPTIENYEAQLQAQLEQQTEAESQPLSTQDQLNTRHVMTNRLHQHQHQHHLQQRQQQMQQAQQTEQQGRQQQQQGHGQGQGQQHQQHQQQQQQQQQQNSVSHTRSPNSQPQPQPQPQPTKPLPDSSISAQQQTRPTHNQHYPQYRSTNSQYSQQHHQQEQQEHKQQQNYSSPQHTQQHFTAHQNPSVSAQPQQYAPASQQTPQYAPAQQGYTSTQHQHQYTGGQQHVSSQQRYPQQLGTTSASAASYTAHQSPQFGTSTTTSFNSTDGTYRTSAATMNNPAYVPQRSQSATPSAAAAYRATGAHGLSHHSPTFGPNSGTGQHRSTSASHPTSQSVQAMTGVASFSGNTATDWGLFDTANLDAAGNQGALGLTNTNYAMNPGSVRTSQNTASAFPANSLTNFDTSGLGGGDRYFGVQRR